MFYSLEFLVNASTTVFTLAKFNQSIKSMLKVAKEMLAKSKSSKFSLNNKAPERRQRCFGVQLHIK